MKHFVKLKVRDIASLVMLIILGAVWIMIDHYLIADSGLRFMVFCLLCSGLFWLIFRINQPNRIWAYAHTMALILFPLVVISSLVIHTLIVHDLRENFNKIVMILAFVGLMPYLGAIQYSVFNRRRQN
ncbi:MAG: hypothetical protein JW801_18600 [Bacteroidales bacterium]|nr:hypothetical protein [Bacteroidales bacterium]